MNVIRKTLTWYFSKSALPYWCILLLDTFIVIFIGLFGYYWQFLGHGCIEPFWSVLLGSVLVSVLYVISFRIFHTYSGVFRYTSFVDLYHLSYAMALGSVLGGIWTILTNHLPLGAITWPNCKTLCFIFIGGTMLMWTIRMFVKLLYTIIREGQGVRSAFIYGTKEGGIAVAKTIRDADPKQYSLKGFVCPAKDMPMRYLLGVKVHREDDRLVRTMVEHGIRTLLVSPLQSEYFRTRDELINQLVENKIKIMMVPKAREWDGKSDSKVVLHNVDIEDLLPRDPIEVDMDAISEMLAGNTILITGAAGSIGSEMVRQIAKFGPAELVLVDQAETPMHDVRLFLAKQCPEVKAHTIVTSITNKEHMERLFATYRPAYVFHAAAYKHVPMMEDNPGIAVQNNIYGTRVIADMAVKYGTKKFVMISTDKAVNPTNVMGCSKRICEIYCQSLNKAILDGEIKQSDGTLAVTQFVTTRFGNVLGSNGSVIPIFKEQIRQGGPVCVTHPEIIRFFMLIPEACKLVLEAGTMGKGGEIFVFDMGNPVRIVDLAKRMIYLSGAQNVEIKFTGLRDGEKLYEEVLNDQEYTKPTFHKKIKIAMVREYDYAEAYRNEQELLELSRSFDPMAIVKKMKEIVPEYKSQHSVYEVLDKAEGEDNKA